MIYIFFIVICSTEGKRYIQRKNSWRFVTTICRTKMTRIGQDLAHDSIFLLLSKPVAITWFLTKHMFFTPYVHKTPCKVPVQQNVLSFILGFIT